MYLNIQYKKKVFEYKYRFFKKVLIYFTFIKNAFKIVLLSIINRAMDL